MTIYLNENHEYCPVLFMEERNLGVRKVNLLYSASSETDWPSNTNRKGRFEYKNPAVIERLRYSRGATVAFHEGVMFLAGNPLAVLCVDTNSVKKFDTKKVVVVNHSLLNATTASFQDNFYTSLRVAKLASKDVSTGEFHDMFLHDPLLLKTSKNSSLISRVLGKKLIEKMKRLVSLKQEEINEPATAN